MKNFIILIMVCFFCACTKEINLKPDSALVLPETIEDFEFLLDNTEIMNITAGLPHLSADEYHIPTFQNYQSIFSQVVRNGYIWKSDIFEGQTQIADWTQPYAQIFICNSVLDVLSKWDISNDPERMRIKGWALFSRAYAFYTLASTFSKAYDNKTASVDLGIPLKLSSSVSEVVQRSSVQQTYDQIIKDAQEASELLQQDIPLNKKNRPSKVAAFAFLARVYISMRDYDKAENYADKSLTLYSKLTDFNTLQIFPFTSSFTYNSEETIFFSHNLESPYDQISYTSGALYGVEPTLLSLYQSSDLRRQIYFRINANGNYAVSKGINSATGYPFTGLATDEMYLIKAECLARRYKIQESLSYLNALVKTRIQSGSFENITAVSATEALEQILIERRRALIWRCIRWTDLKRLNIEGKNIILTRHLNGAVYTLEPNSPKYVLPIPNDEIALSGLEQNIR